MKKLLLYLLFTLCYYSVQAQTTQIWLVRHAEKELDPENKNPNLSAIGLQRAVDLAKFLDKENIDVAYLTDTKRTRQTIDSLIIPKLIFYKDYKTLPQEIFSNYAGKTVIVVGHSNTILETIEAFGVKRPINELNEGKDYDYIFNLKLKGKSKKLKVSQYGKPHRL